MKNPRQANTKIKTLDIISIRDNKYQMKCRLNGLIFLKIISIFGSQPTLTFTSVLIELPYLMKYTVKVPNLEQMT